VTPRAELAQAVGTQLVTAFAQATHSSDPYSHWRVDEVFPAGLPQVLRGLSFPAPRIGGVSGKRECHNDQRHYFNAANNARFEVCGAVAEAFQSSCVVRAIEAATGVCLSGAYVRLEYAQDVDGFWLEPHTDLGVKRFTMLIYLAEEGQPVDLGTDLYRGPGTWAKRAPFVDNTALVFVPGADTWHGLERRPIPGVRRSVIMNYVTDEWQARDQLAYPATPVRV
jgi:hypothetical protein